MEPSAELEAIHHEIESIYEEINGLKVRFRRTDKPILRPDVEWPADRGVNRDFAICCLLNKAATTKAAIFHLIKAGFADDAYSLCRVLTENAIVVLWLLKGDEWIEKLDAYCVFMDAARVQLASSIEKYLPSDSELQMLADIPDETLSFVRDIFGPRSTARWTSTPTNKNGVSVAEMFEDLNSGPGRGAFYEVAYWDMSFLIHSAPPSLLALQRYLSDRYEVAVRKDALRAHQALGISNLATALLLQGASDRLGLGLDDKLKQIQKKIEAAAWTPPVD